MAVTFLLLRRLPTSWKEWLGFLVALAVISAVAIYLDRRRRQGLQRAASELGFSFDELALDLPHVELRKLALLKRKSDLSNALKGSFDGVEAVVLDCQVGSGRSAYTQTVACFRLAGRSLPGFEQSPEGLSDKIAAAFGSQDIDFESNPQYSNRYRLRGTDEAAVRSLFQPGILAFFEQHTGWCVEGEGEWLGVYHRAKTVRPHALRAFLVEAREISRVFGA